MPKQNKRLRNSQTLKMLNRHTSFPRNYGLSKSSGEHSRTHNVPSLLTCSDKIWESDSSSSSSTINNIFEDDDKENIFNTHEQTFYTFQTSGIATQNWFKTKRTFASNCNQIETRKMPLPILSWVDSKELSLLICRSEDLSLVNRTPNLFTRNPSLTPVMRTVLFEWLMEVCEVYKLKRVTFYLTMDYIDRYLCQSTGFHKSQFQLLGITCLFIAAKVEEIYPPKLAELAYVTDKACNESDIIKQESLVLSKLLWDVQPCTCIGWLTLYLQLLSSGSNVQEFYSKISDFVYPQFSPHMFMISCMLMDLCALDSNMLEFKYSVIATSVIYYLTDKKTALYISGYTWETITDCVNWMHPFVHVVSKELDNYTINVPMNSKDTNISLRKINPAIILEEEHLQQNHRATINLLKQVHKITI